MSRVWLITGASSGFGRALANAVLAAGGRVAAGARDPARVRELAGAYPDACRPVELDVTVPAHAAAAVVAARAAFGRIDVLSNVAGYGLLAAVEDVTDAAARRNFETNYFGPLRLIQAVLPTMREQGAGHIINMSAVAGFVNYPGFGVYGASKFALEGLSEALRQEVAPFGIRVTLLEPGPFRTDFATRSLDRPPANPVYDGTVGKFGRLLDSIAEKQPGDPARGAAAVIAAVESADPPFRLPLGPYAVRRLRQKIVEWTATAAAAEPTAKETDFPR
ncbi:MAG TPA: SDR family NAD(P)-dependent oxidoreductase [Gemmataceae bacterium]|nr:SDR family NAD(P)-dependent oxidoreductase [Gemmataceae bacterium]